MKRTVIVERDVLEAVTRGCTKLEIPPDAVVTPLAADVASQKKVLLVRMTSAESTTGKPPESAEAPSQIQCTGVTVAIGSDHGGFDLKSQLTEYLRSLGCTVDDVGTKSVEPCDYPDFAYAVGMQVAGGRATLGIMIDGAGVGSCMVVNKIPGIRGACCTHEFMARNAREHNNANVLTLGSRVVGLEVAKAIVGVFLRTAFAGGRHEGRVKKIMDVDQKYRRMPS